MNVKSVEYEKEKNRFIVEFEHENASWFKFLDINIEPFAFHDWLNSVIEDALMRAK